MNRSDRPMMRAAAALLALVTSGCIAYRGGELPAPAVWPLAPPAAKKTVSVVVSSGQTVVDGKQVDAPPAMIKIWREKVHADYVGSGMFSAVLPEGSPADLRAEVRISEDGDANQIWAVISGLTFTVVPVTAHSRMTMRTDLKNADGDLLASVEKSESMRMWIQLLLIFPMPFMWPGSVSTEMFRDLTAATLEEARAKGAL